MFYPIVTVMFEKRYPICPYRYHAPMRCQGADAAQRKHRHILHTLRPEHTSIVAQLCWGLKNHFSGARCIEGILLTMFNVPLAHTIAKLIPVALDVVSYPVGVFVCG